MINAIRGLNNRDQDAAEVGIIESTQQITCYTFSKDLPFVKLYDIPGRGIFTHKTDIYYAEKGLCAFDVLLIFIQNTLCAEDVKLAREAKKYGQTVCFIRSQCDIDVMNMVQYDEIAEVNQEEVSKYLAKIQDFFKKEISAKALDVSDIPIFFVSAPVMYKLFTVKPLPYVFQEAELLSYIQKTSIESRSVC
uniref:IRG-type G domain-containing protein n=1 Tax=Acrobeloides nanus TaxID=290746 RepID=A0A914EAU3_9BILA